MKDPGETPPRTDAGGASIDRLLWYLQHILSLYRAIVFQWPLQQVGQPKRLNTEVQVALLDDSRTRELQEFHDSNCTDWTLLFDHREMLDRLASNQECFLGLLDNRIIAFTWNALKTLYCPEMHCRFGVTDANAINYNTYIHRAYRGQNIYPTMMYRALDDLKSRNFANCYGYVRTANRNSIRAVRKSGGVPCGMIYYGAVFGLQYVFMRCSRAEFFISRRDSAFAYYRHLFARWRGRS